MPASGLKPQVLKDGALQFVPEDRVVKQDLCPAIAGVTVTMLDGKYNDIVDA